MLPQLFFITKIHAISDVYPKFFITSRKSYSPVSLDTAGNINLPKSNCMQLIVAVGGMEAAIQRTNKRADNTYQFRERTLL